MATSRRVASVAVTLIRVGSALTALAVIISFWASPDRLRSLPWCLIAWIGAALVILVTSTRLGTAIKRHLTARHLMIFFLGATLVALLATLLTSRWPTYKLSWLEALYRALPSMRSLPFSWAKAGLQPNQTGGFLAVMTAFAVATALAAQPTSALAVPRGPAQHTSHGKTGLAYRWAGLLLAILGLVVVFMTGSRAALAGLVVATLFLLIWRTARWLWAWGAGIATLLVALLSSGQFGRIAGFFLRDETLDTKLVARLDIWSSAVKAIQDHFFTGIGIGVF
ncbi:MAG: O-antigen ligase family protein, partial [Thermoleophilia bacterium]|nr:O-antigen ligase family protein [Thermoleophilia bacterium]